MIGSEYLHITRLVPAGRAQVWREWTDAAALLTWYWPPTWDTSAAIDLRPGGGFRISAPAMDLAVSGEFESVEPGTRLVHNWQWAQEDAQTIVTVGFADRDGQTEVSITHSGFATAEDRDMHIQGWNDCIDRLVALHS